MKSIILILSLISMNVFASDSSGEMKKKGMSFKERKSHHVKMMDKRIKKISKARDCAAKATSKEEMKKCHKGMGKKMRKMNMKMRKAKKTQSHGY